MASGFEDRGRDPPSENNSGQSGQEQRAPLGPEGSAGRPVLLDLDIVAGPRLRPLDVGCLEVLRPLLLLLLSGHEGRGGVLRWLSLDCLHSVVRDRGFWGGFYYSFFGGGGVSGVRKRGKGERERGRTGWREDQTQESFRFIILWKGPSHR